MTYYLAVTQGQRNRYAPGVACACSRFTQGFFEHGVLHGIDAVSKYKQMKLLVFSGLFTIEWE